MSQQGNVFRKGCSWFLRYRDSLVLSVCAHCGKARDNHGKEQHQYEGERRLVRKMVCKKIAPVAEGTRANVIIPPADVLELAEEEMRAVNSSSIEPGKNLTVQDFVTRVYFPNMDGQKRASTLRGYHTLWDSQLSARCGHFRLRDFKTPQAHKVLADIGRANPEMSRSSLHNMRSFMSAIFRHAIQQGYLEGINPVREAQIPRALEGGDTYAYSLPEVMQMLQLLPDPARTICAVAGFLGLRRGEIMGLQWQDYSGDEIMVSRSVWEGVSNEPKTKKSKAPVPVIVPMQRLLDEFCKSRGNPVSGPIFATMKKTPTPLSLNNVLNRQVLPVLNACVCGKPEDEHAKADHEYQRGARPEWHGWHAFRRGLATNLHDLGVDDKTIQRILRHANVQVTQNSYIKTLDAQSVAAMRQLESLVDVKLLSGSSGSKF